MKEAVHSTKDQQRRKQRVKGKQAKTGKMLQICGFFLQKPDFPIGTTKLLAAFYFFKTILKTTLSSDLRRQLYSLPSKNLPGGDLNHGHCQSKKLKNTISNQQRTH